MLLIESKNHHISLAQCPKTRKCMCVFVKESTLWKPLCVSNTSFVDTDDFMKEMHR